MQVGESTQRSIAGEFVTRIRLFLGNKCTYTHTHTHAKHLNIYVIIILFALTASENSNPLDDIMRAANTRIAHRHAAHSEERDRERESAQRRR